MPDPAGDATAPPDRSGQAPPRRAARFHGVRENWVRVTLWMSCPFNLIAAVLLAMPDSQPGQLIGLPAAVPLPYRALLAFLVGLFGFAYAWLAARRRLDRPLLGLLALGKLGVFAIAAVLLALDAAALPLVGLALGDCLLGGLWLAWLLQTRTRAHR